MSMQPHIPSKSTKLDVSLLIVHGSKKPQIVNTPAAQLAYMAWSC